ncbi:MAG TPA: molybdopterin-dependent oxidoreductase [Acetobacteraceae bacterium]
MMGRTGWASCLALAALAVHAGPASALPTSSFTVAGAVDRPGTLALPDLQALPGQTVPVTYGTGRGPVSASFTGPALWSVLGQAGLTPMPGARNSTLRSVVVATGSDGYAAAFSGGELDPRFGGSRAPALVAYAQNGQPLGTDGFARAVASGDAAGGRYVSNLARLDVIQAPSNPSRGGGVSGSFTLSGLIATPGTYDTAALATLPATTESVTYAAAGRPVSASFTGIPLWTLLTVAGLVTDPAIKNDELRFYVLATGSDGYEATFSLGELDPRFGGGAADLVAYAQDGQPLGMDGFARLVVPGDLAGGRYVSNLVSLQVLDATAVPEPGSLALMLAGLAGGIVLRHRPSRDAVAMPAAG